LPGLQVEELGHKFDLFVLTREFNLVTFEDSRLFLHFNHQSVHAFLQDSCDLSLDLLRRRFYLLQFTLYNLNLVHNESFLSLKSLVVLLHLVLSNIVCSLDLDELMLSTVVALGHPG